MFDFIIGIGRLYEYHFFHISVLIFLLLLRNRTMVLCDFIMIYYDTPLIDTYLKNKIRYKTFKVN